MKHSDTNAPDLAALLATGRPILLDGGLATQCEAMGCSIDDELWSAGLLTSNPRAIVDASRAYLDAGAEIIVTASYQASRTGFVAAGLSIADADALILSSVALAAQAREEFLLDNPDTDHVPLIAASIGPYGAVLHDGSEYTGRYDISADELRDFHRERIELLDQSEADLLACETIPSADEALVLCELLSKTQKRCWVSFCCCDEQRISDGTLIADAAGLFRDHPTVIAVGVNCTAPRFVLPIIGILKSAAPEKSIVVYPNSGETYHADDNSWSGTATALQCKQSAQEWIEAGANLVGGCCRIGPDQIAAMAQCAALKR
ncbi:MAG: homocysteine S-methyltransferase [Gammaproteobacteria bacterium]|nr:homocysteine S-methyltransferase [Gammaproteobacteria bacterium]MDH3428389.1 homocysteine S-methyltransferase [Gammaproteobacteria bacterium]MDH3434768.1 homocysteine S-methyltransferase [Gammaproteobacteria bacterium]